MKIKSDSRLSPNTRFCVCCERFDVVAVVVVMLQTVNFRHDIDSNFNPAVASQLFPTVLYSSLEVSLFFSSQNK